jgi:PAS domain S-box-containing protein
MKHPTLSPPDQESLQLATQALRDSDDRYRSVVAAMAEGVVLLDASGLIVACNASAERILGVASNQILGRSLENPQWSSIRDDGSPFPAGEFPAIVALRTGRPSSDVVLGIKRPDGPLTWLSINAHPLIRKGEATPYASVATFTDITARRRTEEALRRSEELYRSMVQHAVPGFSRSTTDGRVLAANPALVEMLGYASEEEVLKLDIARDVYVDPVERERFYERYRSADRVEGAELRWRRKDGRTITVRISGRPFRDEDGTLQGFEMLVEDVTERRLLEEQLRQSQKMDAVGQLAGGISHDFNNLLTAIIASAELIARELPDDSPLHGDVETVHDAALRGAQLTGKLLAFGRQQPVEVRAVSLGELVGDFARMARRVVPEDVQVTVTVDSPDTTIIGDPGALEQILMNLVTNARDAMPGGGTLTLEVRRTQLDPERAAAYGETDPRDHIVMSVSDTGTGMDAETRRHIFEPFFTTKPAGRGTGLGMAMVYGLTRQHGGHVEVASEPGAGTTVRIVLPAAAADTTRLPAAPQPAVVGGTETILLVEDHDGLRRATTRVLEKHGYAVKTASDGWEAMVLLQSMERAPDLVISDVVMPRTSGPELVSALRAAGTTSRMLLTSGYTAREMSDRDFLDSGVPFLAKPWTIEELLRRVRETLDAPAAV